MQHLHGEVSSHKGKKKVKIFPKALDTANCMCYSK